MIINVLGIAGFFAVVGITGWVMFVYIRAIKNTKAQGELEEYNWDEIKEYKNPLPFGWAVIYVGVIVWAFWYWLIGYPTGAYSQIGEWNQENEEYKASFERKWQNPSEETLLSIGESIFLAKCAPCHGNTGDGIGGKAADLVGFGKADHIAYVVKHGSKGLGLPGGEMAPYGGMGDLNEDDVEAVSKFVANGLKGEGRGKEVYGTNCASCHGEDGKGMDNVFRDITTYGTVADTIHIIKNGKNGNIGNMPAFKKEGTLTELQYKAVAKYILSMGE